MSVLDFQLLADYPDRQFGLAFDDISDDELRAALADTYIVVERLRERQGIESGKLIEEARIHTEGFADATTDTRTLEQIDLRPTGEVRQQTEDELTEQFGPGRWDKRANGLAKPEVEQVDFSCETDDETNFGSSSSVEIYA